MQRHRNFPIIALILMTTAIGCPPGGEEGGGEGGGKTWPRTFGGEDWESAFSVAEMGDGGIILAGFTSSSDTGVWDMYVVKTDAGGSKVWVRTFGGESKDVGLSVAETSDGGIILAGTTHSFGAGGADMYLVKTDAGGNEVWAKAFGGTGDDLAYSVAETSDGGFILAGYTVSFLGAEGDMYVVRTDADGNEVWAKAFGGTGDDLAYSVAETTDGGFVLAGYTLPSDESARDAYVVKTDADGNEVWARTFGGTNGDSANALIATSDGAVILAGYTFTDSPGAGGMDMYLVKVDADGNEVWARNFGGSGNATANAVAEMSDGGFLLAGFMLTDIYGATSIDMYLVKTDANGNEIWARTFGGTGRDVAHAVAETSDGGILLAGTTDSFGAGESDMYVVKTDADGNGPSVPE